MALERAVGEARPPEVAGGTIEDLNHPGGKEQIQPGEEMVTAADRVPRLERLPPEHHPEHAGRKDVEREDCRRRPPVQTVRFRLTRLFHTHLTLVNVAVVAGPGPILHSGGDRTLFPGCQVRFLPEPGAYPVHGEPPGRQSNQPSNPGNAKPRALIAP